MLMIRPAGFGYNAETAASNVFQSEAAYGPDDVRTRAAAEFDGVVTVLRRAGVSIYVFEDSQVPLKPDAVFPNNWISFHEDGTVILYPMLSQTRRSERRMDILEGLSAEFEIREVLDLSFHESDGRYLEGTGSIVFDHVQKIAYACLSPRTDRELLRVVCDRLHYEPFTFRACDRLGNAIYHTNVMMCIAERFAVACLDSVVDERERQDLERSLIRGGKELISITMDQIYDFAGNMLSLKGAGGRDLIAMSQRALDSLSAEQRSAIGRYCEIVPLAIDTIETVGGGSVRCMMAELFLSKRCILRTTGSSHG